MADETPQPVETPPPQGGTGQLSYDQMMMLMEAMRRTQEMRAKLQSGQDPRASDTGDTGNKSSGDGKMKFY